MFQFFPTLNIVLLMKQPKAVGLKEAMLGDEFTFFVKNYLFIWPHWVLVAVHVNSHLRCGMWNLLLIVNSIWDLVP